MKRLTDKHWRNLDPWECCGQDDYCKRGHYNPGGCNNGCIIPKLYRRLALIEEILGEEYDLDHLWQLVAAEQDGRLVVLPCRVGDTVYYRTYDKNATVDLGIQGHKVVDYEVNVVAEGKHRDTVLGVDEFGTSVFLTQEEAEAALKEADK